jgi:hypothetical protein
MLNSDVMQRAVVTDKLLLISAAFQERGFISEVIFFQHAEYLTHTYFISQDLNLPTHFLKLKLSPLLSSALFLWY